MRDILKDKTHFNSLIELRYKLISKINEKLEANLIKPDRLKAVKDLLCTHYSLIIKAKYCRGDNMTSKDVTSDYEAIISTIQDYWKKGNNLLSYKKGKEIVYLNQYVLSMHFDIIDLLSWGILLDLPKEHFQVITNILDQDNVKDYLFEFLLVQKLKNRPKLEADNFKTFSWYTERFGRVKTILGSDDKILAQNELKLFLEKDWYKALYDTPNYNQHNVKNGNYVGYYCFIAAAIVKTKGLDDSSFRENKYYPKDLI